MLSVKHSSNCWAEAVRAAMAIRARMIVFFIVIRLIISAKIVIFVLSCILKIERIVVSL